MLSGQIFVHDYRPATLLMVTGEDAFAFLQGQFTNELRQAVGTGAFGLWLNQKGRVIADSQVLCLKPDEFLVLSAASPATVIQQRLEAYVVADDVSVRDETAAAFGLALGGAGSGERVRALFGAVPTVGNYVQQGDLTAFVGRRTEGENFEIVGPAQRVSDLSAELIAGGGSSIGRDAIELLRIRAGIPAIPADLGPADLPNEGGLETAAISYTKGCYLGQEVMARLKNLGQVRRRLLLVEGPGAPPPRLAPIFQGPKKVGEVRSAAADGTKFAALALLSLTGLDYSAGLSLGPDEPTGMKLHAHG